MTPGWSNPLMGGRVTLKEIAPSQAALSGVIRHLSCSLVAPSVYFCLLSISTRISKWKGDPEQDRRALGLLEGRGVTRDPAYAV